MSAPSPPGASSPDSAAARAPRGIGSRVMVLVAAGSLGTLALLGWVSWRELHEADARIARYQAATAQAIARQIGDRLTEIFGPLQGLATRSRGLLPFASNQALVDEAVRQVWLASPLVDAALVASADGTIVAHEPRPAPLPSAAVLLDVLARARTGWRPVVTGLRTDAGGRPTLILAVPVFDWEGGLAGIVAGVVDPRGRRFAELASPVTRSPLWPTDVRDAEGRVIVASDAHGAGSTDRSLAEARVPLAGWTVVVHHEEGRPGSPGHLLRTLAWLGPLLVFLSLLLAWGVGRSVRVPLAILTREAERLAGGDLSTPIPPMGGDEIGRLARAFEEMRRALAASIEEVARANAVLEARVRARTEELERLNQELQERERIRQRLLDKVMTAQEEERLRLSRELHDEACQTVTALGLRLEAALAEVPPGTPAAEAVAAARDLARRSLDELNRMMHDLRPSVLDDLGFVAALRWYADRHLTQSGVAVRFEVTPLPDRLPGAIETAVFRAVQECFTNIRRHARAEMVLVQIAFEDGVLAIDVEDDGVGFDPAGVTPSPGHPRGLGLLGLKERIELVGGRIQIESAPGRGTLVAIRVPIPETPHA